MDKIFTLKQLGDETRKKKRRMSAGFMDLEKTYDEIRKKEPLQILRVYDVDGKLINDIKRIYITCIRVKGERAI